MSHPFKHPKVKELLGRVAHSIRGGDAFILPSSPIVFVCGGSPDGAGVPSMRRQFLDYARDELGHFRCFLAESAQMDYVNYADGGLQNVAEFEDVMADISTCTILFPESPGSFAELGYFSRNEKLRKKLLIVNNSKLQARDSFIALGPIGLVDRYSDFGPTIQINFDGNPDFGYVKERLTNRVTSRRRRFRKRDYGELSNTDKFFVVFEIVRLFRALTFEGISYAFRSIWRHAAETDLRRILSILVATDHISRRGEDLEFFCHNVNSMPFFQYDNLDTTSTILEVMDLYRRHFLVMAEAVEAPWE